MLLAFLYPSYNFLQCTYVNSCSVSEVVNLKSSNVRPPNLPSLDKCKGMYMLDIGGNYVVAGYTDTQQEYREIQ